DVGNITMDIDGTERVEIEALAGQDKVTVNDLSGTSVTQVAIDLAGVRGGSAADGQVDQVKVNATNGADAIVVASNGGVVTITGLAATVTVAHTDAGDQLLISGNGGDDVINAAGLAAGLMSLTLAGGAGADRLIGSAGIDTATYAGSPAGV